ncbi:8-amino-7-oxononanoate synthase [Qipengyuania sp. JC766]|uniref:8-amino-7-oxononanoate synthase n=1 Tax=Qipengyuania sp. JC766 TaxID=3232139 RepID=UPI00345A4416
MSHSNFHHQDLIRLQDAGRRRALALPEGIDFASNDYLALAGSAALRQAAVAALTRGVALGSGGSRLLRGHTAEHAVLEEEAARFFGSEAALFVGSGFSANSLMLSTLPQAGDLILHDALIHASAHEGMRLSRAAHRSFAHNDVDAARDAIRRWRREGGRGTVWVVFETLYSMDGDIAPVADFAALADGEDTMMVIDEAHAVGACGPQGRGLAADLHGRDDVLVLATCGKALGCEGALILLPETYRDFLVNRGRNFIFSTAPSPLMAEVARSALRLVAAADDQRTRLRTLIEATATEIAPSGFAASGSHIQPIVLGDDRRTMAVADALRSRGFDIRGIRPPSVPDGSARLRISITLNASEEAIAMLGDALKEIV